MFPLVQICVVTNSNNVNSFIPEDFFDVQLYLINISGKLIRYDLSQKLNYLLKLNMGKFSSQSIFSASWKSFQVNWELETRAQDKKQVCKFILWFNFIFNLSF